MAFRATVLSVLIASPGDTEDERKRFPDVLLKWNREHSKNKGIVLLPVGWETHTYATYEPGQRPQGIINKQIVKDSDIVIAVFRARLGTSTGEFESGTVEEIEKSARAQKAVAVYFSSNYQEPIDLEQFAMVRDYKSKIQKEGITSSFSDTNQFCELLRDHLSGLVQKAIVATPAQNDAMIPPEIPMLLSEDQPTILSQNTIINNLQRQAITTPFKSDFFRMIGSSISEPVFSIMIRMSQPFAVFESTEIDYVLEWGKEIFDSLFDGPSTQLNEDHGKSYASLLLEVKNKTVFRFSVYNDGTVFLEHAFPSEGDSFKLTEIIAIYKHHTDDIQKRMQIVIPDSRVSGVAMKLSCWPSNGIYTEPVFQCTAPKTVTTGASHWDVDEGDNAIDFSEFFRTFLFDALANNKYRHFEEAVRGFDIESYSAPTFPKVNLILQSSESTGNALGVISKSRSKFDREF